MEVDISLFLFIDNTKIQKNIILYYTQYKIDKTQLILYNNIRKGELYDYSGKVFIQNKTIL